MMLFKPPPMVAKSASPLFASCASPPPLIVTRADSSVALLPPDTLGLVAISGVRPVVAALGLGSLSRRYAAELEPLEEGLAQIGLTLSDLLNPAGLGLAPDAPVALAWLGLQGPTLALCLTLSGGAGGKGEAAFDGALATALESGEVPAREERWGDARVTLAGSPPELAVVRRAGYAYLMVAQRRGPVAHQDPAAGLPSTAAWQQAMAGAGGDTAWLFVNVPAIRAQAAAPLRERLEHLGGGPRAARREGELALLEGLLGSFGGVAFGVTLSEGRVDVSGRVVLPADTLVGGLLRNRSYLSPIQRALTEPPFLLMDGALQPAGLRRVVELVTAAAGVDLGSAMTIVKAFGGLSTDPFELLTGELGIALTGPTEGAAKSPFGFMLSIGVTDVAAAGQMLERLATLAGLASLVEAERGREGFRLRVPGMGRVDVMLVGSTVVATSLPDVIDRLRGGGPTIDSVLSGQELRRLALAQDTAGLGLFDFGVLTRLMHRERTESVEAVAVPLPDTASEEERRQHALRSFRVEMARLYRERDETRRRRSQELMTGLGGAGLTAQSDQDGLTVRGGWYTAYRSPAALLAAGVDHIVESERADERLEKRISALSRQMLGPKVPAATDRP